LPGLFALLALKNEEAFEGRGSLDHTRMLKVRARY
jgi:hypothetical protein